jgi:glutamyl-tRNA synthetase
LLRFALSPTKDIDIENLRVALFNYIIAKQRGEKFHILIEDSVAEEKVQESLDILKICGLEWDSISYQSQNLKFHQQFATKLLMEKKAFNCFCTKESLKKRDALNHYDDKCLGLSDSEVIDKQEPFRVRVLKPNSDISFFDQIQGDMLYKKGSVDSFVILEIDKSPTRNFACAIDDMLLDISLVIREEESLQNTPKEIIVREYLGFTKEIEYAHPPIIKSDTVSSVRQLLDEGFLPRAVVNYLLLLGNKAPKEIFTLDEAIEWFSLKNLSKTVLKFDLDKLRSIDRKHRELKSEGSSV